MFSMRILHVISSANPAGGGPIEGIQQLRAALIARGHSVNVASLDGPDAPWLALLSIPIIALGPAIHRYHFSARLVPWLRKHAGDYDVVIANGIWAYASFGVWRALRKTGQPYVVFPHGMLDPWFKHRYPLKHLRKWLYWPWAEYRVLRDAAAVIFTCEEERILARRSFWLYDAKERVTNYGTALPPADPAAQERAFWNSFPQLEGKRIVLFMGRIHPKKGCDLAIEAFGRVLAKDSDWRLVLAGPDQVGLRGRLERIAQRFGVAHLVTWAGMVQGDVKWGAFRAAEVFLLPSHQENFGIVVAEALACGVPTLISNKVNIWREVKDDGGGLVAEDNVQGATELLRSWIGMSEEKRALMRHCAKACFEERFAIGKAAMSLIEILSSLTVAGTPSIHAPIDTTVKTAE
jgi:glycosyltransferase involved in cell wall biosynthesis